MRRAPGSCARAVANCVPAIPTFLQLAQAGMEGPADPAERIEAPCASMARLARFEPASIVVLTGPVGDRSEDEARTIVCAGLREVAAAARVAGVRVGLEPTHRSESHVTSFISTIGEAIALLDEARVDDVGVMVDTVHVWDTPALAEEVALHAARVTGFHAGDKHAAGDPSRLLPGGASRTPKSSPGYCGRPASTATSTSRSSRHRMRSEDCPPTRPPAEPPPRRGG